MRNLLNSTQIATIFLDRETRVKRYTERAREVVRLIESDIGRPLSDLTLNLRYDALISDCERVLDSLIPVEREVRDEADRWQLVRVIPYRRADSIIDGLVVTVVDIDRTKRAEQSAAAWREHFRSIVETMREPTMMLDAELRVVRASPSFLRTFAGRADEVEGRLIYQLGNGQWDIPRLRDLLERILPDHAVIEDFRGHEDHLLGDIDGVPTDALPQPGAGTSRRLGRGQSPSAIGRRGERIHSLQDPA